MLKFSYSTWAPKWGGEGGVGGVATPPEFAVDKSGGRVEPPPNFERIFLKIDHICYYVQVISIGGLAPLKLIQLYSKCNRFT